MSKTFEHNRHDHDSQPKIKPLTFERIDGKMGEAEHNHILMKAYRENDLHLYRNPDGGFELGAKEFANRTEAWVWLYEMSKSKAPSGAV